MAVRSPYREEVVVAIPISELVVPAPEGWRALLIDWDNGGYYPAPIVAWSVGDQGASLLPICATNDPPGYPRIPSEDELVAVYEPYAVIGQGDYEAAEELEKAVREARERAERHLG